MIRKRLGCQKCKLVSLEGCGCVIVTPKDTTMFEDTQVRTPLTAGCPVLIHKRRNIFHIEVVRIHKESWESAVEKKKKYSQI